MLTHGVIKALRLGFNVILVNPKGTTNSDEHDKIMKEKVFDKHTASAYLIALKGLGMLNDVNFRFSETAGNSEKLISFRVKPSFGVEL